VVLKPHDGFLRLHLDTPFFFYSIVFFPKGHEFLKILMEYFAKVMEYFSKLVEYLPEVGFRGKANFS